MDLARNELPAISSRARRRRFLQLFGLTVLAAAWVVFFVGSLRANELREKLGPGIDVYDALARDHAVGRILEPYALAALCFDFLAFLLVYFAHTENGCSLPATLIWSLLWVASFGGHGLAFLL